MPELFKTLLALMSTLIGVVYSQVATLDFSKTIFFEKMQLSIFFLTFRLTSCNTTPSSPTLEQSDLYTLYKVICLVLIPSISVQVLSGLFQPVVS